jgi:hypothetical protein
VLKGQEITAPQQRRMHHKDTNELETVVTAALGIKRKNLLDTARSKEKIFLKLDKRMH